MFEDYFINCTLNLDFSELNEFYKIKDFLESYDIFVGIGSACNEKTKTVDPILEYMQSPALAINTIRVSISPSNTKEEIDLLISKIKEIGEK